MTCSRMGYETIEHHVYLRFVFFIGSNADPDPDPAFYLIADKDPDLGS